MERREWRDAEGHPRKKYFFLRGFGRTRDRRDREEAARWPSLRSKKGLLKSSCLELAEVRVEGGKGHQRHGWVLESLVRHQGRPKGTSTGGGDPPRDGNALSEREPNPNQSPPRATTLTNPSPLRHCNGRGAPPTVCPSGLCGKPFWPNRLVSLPLAPEL